MFSVLFFFFLPFSPSFTLNCQYFFLGNQVQCALQTFFSVEMVCVANAACSLLWGENIIWSMPGSHQVVLPSGETASGASVLKLSSRQKIQVYIIFHSKFDQLKTIFCWAELQVYIVWFRGSHLWYQSIPPLKRAQSCPSVLEVRIPDSTVLIYTQVFWPLTQNL